MNTVSSKAVTTERSAYDYGAEAFYFGMPSVPALDTEFMKTLKGLGIGEAIAPLSEWARGWHVANTNHMKAAHVPLEFVLRSYHNEWITVRYQGKEYTKSLYSVRDDGRNCTARFTLMGHEYQFRAFIDDAGPQFTISPA